MTFGSFGVTGGFGLTRDGPAEPAGRFSSFGEPSVARGSVRAGMPVFGGATCETVGLGGSVVVVAAPLFGNGVLAASD